MKTPSEWLQHYEKRAKVRCPIPWKLGAELTSEEREAVASSLPEFQLGESSEGRHLIRDARTYGERAGDSFYPQTIRYFIAEEQRHALVLGRFLELNGIPLVKATWADSVFRRARNLFPGLELSIAVLVTGELIAQVYYRVLRDATGSALLRTLCRQILRDEVSHVAFQAEQLARLRATRGALLYVVTMAWQRLMFLAAVVAIGLSHRSLIRRGGLGHLEWWRACWERFEAAFSAKRRVEARKAMAMQRPTVAGSVASAAG